MLLKPVDPDLLLSVVATLIGTVRDLGEAIPEVRAGEREQLLEHLAGASSALDLTSQRLALLIESGREFTAQHDPDKLGNQLARAARSMMRASYVLVCLVVDRSRTAVRLRALFVSGYTESAVLCQGVLEPGTPFPARPFSPAALSRRVRGVLDEV